VRRGREFRPGDKGVELRFNTRHVQGVRYTTEVAQVSRRKRKLVFHDRGEVWTIYRADGLPSEPVGDTVATRYRIMLRKTCGLQLETLNLIGP
jgi:hypothetical protein